MLHKHHVPVHVCHQLKSYRVACPGGARGVREPALLGGGGPCCYCAWSGSGREPDSALAQCRPLPPHAGLRVLVACSSSSSAAAGLPLPVSKAPVWRFVCCAMSAASEYALCRQPRCSHADGIPAGWLGGGQCLAAASAVRWPLGWDHRGVRAPVPCPAQGVMLTAAQHRLHAGHPNFLVCMP